MDVTFELQEGFDGDDVVVSATGMDSMRASGVTTRMQVGLARSMRLPLPAQPVRLHVEVPGLHLVQDIQLPATRPLWIGVSLSRARDRLEVKTQDHPFPHF